MSFEQIINFKQVNDRIYSSGQPAAPDFQLIAKQGFSTVINLLPHSHPEALKNEADIVKSHGMRYLSIEVPFDLPRRQHWQQFRQYLDESSTDKIWIHCLLNYRVSAFLFLYLRQSLGLSANEARQKIFTDWQANAVWSDVMCDIFREDA